MTAHQEDRQSTEQQRPGGKHGVASEFTVFSKIKPGQVDSLREVLAGMSSGPGREKGVAAVQDIGTLHDARHVIFDDDTRHMFASVFDGSWDQYIDDFATTIIADFFDAVFSHMEGFPGIKDPNVKDWFVAHQGPALNFITAYPELTVQQIWKDQRVNEAFQEVLDTQEFRAALENPALADLLANPAFQKLLDEAQG